MTGQLLQFGGSLIAILALAWLARRLELGGDTRIRDEAHLRDLAEEALYAFDPVDIAIDRAGVGALARDRQGRVMLLRRHGSHFVSRLLDNHLHVRLDRNLLEVGTGEKRFGKVTLDLGDQAPAWAASQRRLQP
jgi:hypothetical protein